MRMLALLALAATAPALGAQDAPVPVDQEYEQKLAGLQRLLADEHANVGRSMGDSGMWQWARVEYNNAQKALGCTCGRGADACPTPTSPTHEKVCKGLGLSVWNADVRQWEIDPAKRVEVINLKSGDDLERLRADYQKKLDAISRKMGKAWHDLGAWCQKNLSAQKDKAEAAFRRAIEYDPLNKDARTKLGHKKQKEGGWLSKEELELRKELKEGIAKAPKGAPSDQPSDVETKMGLKMRNVATDFVRIQAPHLDVKQLEGLMQHAQHAHDMFVRIFKQGTLLERPILMTLLQSKSQHDAYVDIYAADASAERKEFSKGNRGSMGLFAEVYQADAPIEFLQDYVIHNTAQVCSRALAGGNRHWIHEGLAYYFTLLMHESATMHCVDMRGTGAGQEGKDYRDPTVWPIVIREWLKTGEGDPDVYKVFKCKKLSELRGGDPVKAWSLVEFLVTEHRDKFIDFMQKLRSSKEDDDEKVFGQVFGWSLSELDNRWKVYARGTFGEGK